MTAFCQPTKTPSPESFDIPSLRERYRQERDKRLNRDTTNQYVRATDVSEDVYEIDPHRPVAPREAIAEDLDVAILGAGWTGLLAAYYLKQAGVSTFRAIDHAGGWGGVWYWNRYPGLQCDNDAYCYLPLLEESGFMPSQKFANGYEIRGYMETLVDQFGLGDGALFHTRVTGLVWDDAIDRWHVTTDRGDDLRARFVVMANGLLNIPKLPGVPGIADFKGKMFHTGRWDYDYTGGTPSDPVLDKLADKRVAIIGTGATAIQAVPFLGKYAKELIVFQRTPSTVDKRVNPKTDPEWVKSLKPGWQKERQANFHRAAMDRFKPGEPDLICDIWTEISRNCSAELGGNTDVDLGEYYALREVVDYQVMERLRARVEELVHDKATAEALKPWYRFLCKRPASNDDFYPTFNRPNVRLVDVSAGRGVERISETGVVAGGVEHEVDCIIFASGFEASSSLERKWGIATITGHDGVSLYDHWRGGYTSLHGVMTRGFPNMFFTGYVQSALNSSTTEQMSRHVEHMAHIVARANDRGLVSVEPTAEAEAAWVKHLRETAVDISAYVMECTPSYFNAEGATDAGTGKPKSYAGEVYGPGWDAYLAVLGAWRDADDLSGMEVKTDPAATAVPA